MKRKIASMLAISMIATNNMTTLNVFASDYVKDKVVAVEKQITEEIAATKAETKKFSYIDNEAYIKEFRMPYENIKSIKTNAGNFDSQVIGNAIDGKIETYWETGRLNNDNFKNEVTVEFKDPVSIDRIAFAARQSDRKGFPEEFEIYGSNTTNGDDFHLVATGYAGTTPGLVIT